MNTELHVQRFRATHRVRDDAGRKLALDAQARLLDGELEAALESVAGRDELVLLRRLSVRVRLSSRHGDRDNARHWSDALALSLQQALQQGDAQTLLRFATPQHALRAFAADALQGCGARDWAWQQLGLLPGRHTGDHDHASRRQALLRLLAHDPEQGVPLLRSLFFGPHWPALVAQLHAAELRGLAQAVLARLTGSAAADFADDPAALEAGGTPAAWAAAWTAAAPQDPRRAPAWLHATLRAVPDAARAHWALRLAAMLDAPALARRGATAVDAQLRIWRALDGADDTLPTAASAQPDQAHATAPSRTPSRRARNAHVTDGATVNEPVRAGRPGAPHAPARPAAPSAARTRVAHTTDDDQPTLEDRSGRTQLGGLLYLPRLLPLCGALPLLEDEALWPSLPQALHQLALALWPMAADDPAALAFCGLAPHQPPPVPDPDAGRAPARDAAVQRALALVHEHLSQRLPDWRGPALLTRLLCRAARISADPGWIDVHFALRDVSVELRRAAIDLDPGFLPWLGVVLRYRYE